jgi:hypothetical protein
MRQAESGHDVPEHPASRTDFGVGSAVFASAAVARARHSRDVAVETYDRVKTQAVFALVASGVRVRAIAAELNLTPATVGRIRKRLGFAAPGQPISVATLPPAEHRDELLRAIQAAWMPTTDPTPPPLDSERGRSLLRTAGLDTPASCVLAEQLARQVLDILHPGVEVTPGRLMVAMVQVARDPDGAYALAGYDPMPTDPSREAALRTARSRAAYVRADWIDFRDYDPQNPTQLNA